MRIIKNLKIISLVLVIGFAISGIGLGIQISSGAGVATVSAACDNNGSNGTLPDCTNAKDKNSPSAATDPAAKAAKTPCTSENCDLVKKYVNPLINMLSAAVGIAVIISIIYGGIQYTTSEGDPQKAAKARAQITNAVIALIAFMFLYAFLQWIVPGGVLH